MRPTTPTAIARGRDDLLAWKRSKPRDFYAADHNLQRVLQMHLGAELESFATALHQTGSAAATRLDELAALSSRDENLPVLRRWDGIGQPTEEVVFHAAYHELGAGFWGAGALELLAQPGGEVAAGAHIYLLDQNGEAGHACPLACTAGLVKLLAKVGSEEQRRRLLPALTTRDYATRLHASQFITEVQGGSDVGANGCVATPAPDVPGQYRITGEKWFCSVADASLFVVSARLPDAKPGTAGLGLFLVPRLIDGAPNGFALRRLKTKLGTRSMASGEIDFDGARAEPIGPVDQGFRNLVGIVLDTSRVHNALAAAAFMRRAYVEARSFARFRRAFGHAILEFPAVQQTLARMRVATAAAVATTFRLLALGAELERQPPGASESRRAARRIHVMVNKYATAVACTEVVRQGIEILGGNGTIEDFSILPRLYRDAIVLESWEGSHNTLCAQILRDLRTRGLGQAWLDDVGAACGGLGHASLATERARAERLVTELGAVLERLARCDEREASALIRHAVDRMATLHGYVSLLGELDWERTTGIESDKATLVALYRLLQVERADPLTTPELDALTAAAAAVV